MTSSPAPETTERLEQTWRPATGFPGVLAEVNNQPLGVRFMVTSLMFFVLGGIQALLMRVQLTVSENTFLGPQVYNELFTMHGSTMMFLFAVPFLEGLALYILPMMIGSRDVAFPRLTAYGYWCYLFGGLIFYASFFAGAVPDVGWFGYTPLSTARFTGIATDFWLLGLSLVEVAGLTAGLEIVVTIIKFRAPGMTLGRMPMFVWTLLVAGLMILVAFTILLTATVLLEMDRTLETRFFDVHRGGNNLLWQHLFWFFGHPEVYIMFLPATGIVSMVVAAFSGRPLVGYLLIVMAIMVTGFVSFGLWVHHMFTAGLPHMAAAFFTASSLMIAIASGVQVFAWIATLWGSGPDFRPPLLFVLGFLFLFVLGGLTGVMVAVVPFDVQVHDTYFIVAHFHYVLIGGVLFPIFAGLYYWIPKITGRMLDDRLGALAFWLTFIGFNLTFFPMHIMGFLGLPRRVFTYPEVLQLDGYNILSTVGAFLQGLGAVVFLADVLYALWRGASAGDNPWRADSVEWSVSSPPPVYTHFRFPIVSDRHPLWAAETSRQDPVLVQLQEALAGEPQEWRGNLVTDALDARPQAIQYLPGSTYLPLWSALGTTTVALGVLSRAYILAGFGTLATVVAIIFWLKPRQRVVQQQLDSELDKKTGLQLLPTGTQATGWWGMLGLLVMLASAWGALFYSYFYIRLFSSEWPQGGISPPDWLIPLIGFGLLAASLIGQARAMRAVRGERLQEAGINLAITFVLGLLFLAIKIFTVSTVDFFLDSNAYASLFYLLNITLGILVAVGLAMNGAAQLRLARGLPAHHRALVLPMEILTMYWSFIVAISLPVFLVVFVSPHV